jgi:hypothetical protein
MSRIDFFSEYKKKMQELNFLIMGGIYSIIFLPYYCAGLLLPENDWSWKLRHKLFGKLGKVIFFLSKSRYHGFGSLLSFILNDMLILQQTYCQFLEKEIEKEKRNSTKVG